jgi:hypothetical protein
MAALQREGLQSLVVAGGVGANASLRQRLNDEAGLRGAQVFFPPLRLCTDNGAMNRLRGGLEVRRGRRRCGDRLPDLPALGSRRGGGSVDAAPVGDLRVGQFLLALRTASSRLFLPLVVLSFGVTAGQITTFRRPRPPRGNSPCRPAASRSGAG